MIGRHINHFLAIFLLQVLCWDDHHVSLHVQAHGNISPHRHLLLEDISMVVMLGQAEQTPGPFAEEDDDYVRDTNDLTLAGTAGSPGGLTQDRRTVTDGVPITVTVNVYDVSTPSVGVELPNVEVFLWHTDAKGVYSAVADERNGEITDGQVWCRGIQITNDDGKATFDTILPGWYPGRAIHYHLRLRYPGAVDFAATSQLYISDDDLASYLTVPPYSFNPSPTTPLLRDSIFVSLEDPRIMDLLTLKMEGSVDTGYTASVNVGLVAPPGMVEIDNPTTAPTAAPLVPVARPTFAFQETQQTSPPIGNEATTESPPTPKEQKEEPSPISQAMPQEQEGEDIAVTDENEAKSSIAPPQNFCFTITTGILSILFGMAVI